MKRGPKPKCRVEIVWEPDFAYAVGLIVADGSLSKDYSHLDFTSKDLDLIEVFVKCLKLSGIKIGKKKSSTSSSVYYRVQFGDVTFHSWLRSIGIHPNKSKTIQEVHNIPEEYFFDFLRGVWDGDGTIYEVRDSRWPKATIVSIGFASGSKPFLNWLKDQLSLRIQVRGFITLGKNSFQLRYVKSDSIAIAKSMFYKKDLPGLHRKFAKAQKILRMSDTHS